MTRQKNDDLNLNLDRAQDRDALENWPDFDVLQQGVFGIEVRWNLPCCHTLGKLNLSLYQLYQ